jgi:hypothetical protein
MKPKVQYRIHKSSLPVPVLSQTNPVHTTLSRLQDPSKYYPPTHLHLGLPSGLFPSDFLTNNLYAYLLAPIRATWPAYLILLDLITLIILGEENRSLSSSLCSFLHPLRSKYPPQHPVLKHPQSVFIP